MLSLHSLSCTLNMLQCCATDLIDSRSSELSFWPFLSGRRRLTMSSYSTRTQHNFSSWCSRVKINSPDKNFHSNQRRRRFCSWRILNVLPASFAIVDVEIFHIVDHLYVLHSLGRMMLDELDYRLSSVEGFDLLSALMSFHSTIINNFDIRHQSRAAKKTKLDKVAKIRSES